MKNYNDTNYILEFEAEGLKFLFQELMYYHYYPKQSVMTFNDNILRSLIHKDVWEEMGVQGVSLLTEPSTTFFVDKGNAIKKDLEILNTLVKEDTITVESFNTIWNLFEQTVKNYSYFNIAYLEKVYNQSDKSAALLENLDQFESLKNKVKDDFNQIFFFDNGSRSIFLNKLAKQFSISFDDIEWYSKKELLSLFDNASIYTIDLSSRKQSYVFYPEELLQGDDARVFINEMNTSHTTETVSELTGNIANKGEKVIGKVAVININYDNFEETRQKMADMKQGEILVSRTTDPSIIEACKKASAIITDIGGMLSHAAITAREFKIPCIVGTKIATTILKTGDMVEVDATTGIVKII